MAVTRVGTFPIQTVNTSSSAHLTITYTPQAVGDLVVLDVVTNSPTTACTGMSGGGCASWIQVGTAQTNNAGGYVISSSRWMGVISAAHWSSGSVTATATHASTPADSKITGALFADSALAPNVVWTVDANHQQVITTAATSMLGFALTSSGANGIAYAHWLPQNSGTSGPGSPWTSAVDTWWTNVVSWRAVTATGTVAAANAVSSSGQYSRRITIFQAKAAGGPVDLAGTAPAAGSASGALARTTPARLLGIGPDNPWALQMARRGAPEINVVTLAELEAGYAELPYLGLTADDGRVRLEVPADGPETSGGNGPRIEWRENNSDGTDASWDPSTGTHTLTFDTIVTTTPTLPDTVMAQVFNDTGNTDLASLRLQQVSGTTRLRFRYLGTSVAGELAPAGTAVGQRLAGRIEISGGTVKLYLIVGAGTPVLVYTSPTVATGLSCYFKAGCYLQSSQAGAIGAVEMAQLEVAHEAAGLAGSVDAASSATGALSVARPLGGSLPAASTAAGAVSVARTLAGPVSGASTAAGAMRVTRPLGATITAGSSASGTLTVIKDGSLVGSVSAVSAASGALSVARGLAADVVAASSSSADLTPGRALALAGVVAASSSADGFLSVVGESVYGGTMAAASSADGALSVARSLAASVDVVAELSAAWHVERPPQPLPTPGDPLPPASSGWRPSPPSTYRPPTVIYADA
jgi:hypothetical protein